MQCRESTQFCSAIWRTSVNIQLTTFHFQPTVYLVVRSRLFYSVASVAVCRLYGMYCG